jgi:hypothetical protein
VRARAGFDALNPLAPFETHHGCRAQRRSALRRERPCGDGHAAQGGRRAAG